MNGLGFAGQEVIAKVRRAELRDLVSPEHLDGSWQNN